MAGMTNRRVLRSLDHMWQGTNNKFVNKLRPTYAMPTPTYVPPKDRIAFWNIVPGDVVRVRSGAVAHDEHGQKIRGEGIVQSIDRTTNRVYLRDLDDHHKLAPKNIKHTVPRLVDPEAGEEKGYSGNVTSVPRPVHYSKLMLKVPDTEYYASRIVRSKPYFDRQKGMFVWKRFAIVKVTDADALRSGETVKKFEVPWPKGGQRRRPFHATHADGRTVEEETWVPWVPEDPVLLPARKPRSTPAGEALAAAKYAEWEAQVAKKRALAESLTVATPPGARTYEGFVVRKTMRPPPIAQAPKASEMVHLERQRLSDFVQATETQAHLEQGGAIFAASDYLDVAPLVGPAAGGEWGALQEASTGAKRDESGRLVAPPGQMDLHAMPIELLMGKDLANERGLKWRMRRWKAAREQEAVALAEKQKESQELLKELKALAL